MTEDNPGLPLGADGGQVALIDPDGTTTSYGDLAGSVERLADDLAPRRGAVAFLAARNDSQTVVRLLACLRAGVVAALVDPAPKASLQVARREYRPELQLGFPAGVHEAEMRDEPQLDSVSGPTDLLLPTSGSTGSPKMVRLTVASLTANARSICEALDIRSDDRALANLPLHYSYGLSILTSHLVAGATVVLTSESALRPGHWEAVRRHRVSSMAGVPYSYELFRRVGMLDMELPALRYMSQAGGRLPTETVVEFHERLADAGRQLYVMYGQTEATARMSVLQPHELPEHAGSVGHPIPGGRFSITGPDQTGAGEVHYTGPNVMLGYAESRVDLDKPDELRGELPTGDLGRLDDDGRLWLTGRAKRILKLYGERVSLDDIEDLMSTNGPCAAVDLGNDRLGLFLENHPSEGAIRSLERSLGVPPRTVRAEIIPSLPRTQTGKIDYPRLRPNA